ncbi:SCP-like protein [Oesophagostomum dentatum]|uniref:SCP-like protein n=1 Tax=Oesophagostomum dentatum TaxID=61180 RepID=A0A0B1SPF1_OESDE|nr:SCP-like protein [Oesophagostomum dentatum]
MTVSFAGKAVIHLVLLSVTLRLSQQQAICDPATTGVTMPDAERKVMHDFLNDIRQQVAEGTADNYQSKKLPAAKNMYKLEYDCAMEVQLQAEIDKCTGEATLVNDYAQNIVRLTQQQLVALDLQQVLLPAALQTWYDPVRYYGLTDSSNKYTDDRLQTFANKTPFIARKRLKEI